MVFKPRPCPTRWEGIAVALWIVLLDFLLVVWAIRRPADTFKFVLIVLMVASLPLLAHIVYRTWSAFTLEYWVDRNAITVHWANIRQIIPLQAVERVVAGRTLAADRPGLLAWPAPFLRSSAVPGLGRIHLCATQPPVDCLFLETADELYALSPAAPDLFMATVQERYSMGPAQVVQFERRRLSIWDRMLPSDALGIWLLGTGLLGVLVLFGALMISFPDLPDVLTVRYNSAGVPEEISAKGALFRLPIIGTLAWVGNGLLGLWLMARRQRTGAYMLWGGAIVVQVASMFALISLIT